MSLGIDRYVGASGGTTLDPAASRDDQDLEPYSSAGTGGDDTVDVVRNELLSYLRRDDTRLGDVWRRLEEGQDAEQIAAELGVATSNLVWNYSVIVHALLNGDLPDAPSVALNTARRYRTLLKQGHWSDVTRSYLEDHLDILERRSGDVSAIDKETEESRRQTEG